MNRKIKLVIVMTVLVSFLSGCSANIAYSDDKIEVKKKFNPGVLFVDGENLYYLYDKENATLDDLDNSRKVIEEYHLKYVDYSDMSNAELTSGAHIYLDNEDVKDFTIKDNPSFDNPISFEDDYIENINISNVGNIRINIDAGNLQELNIDNEQIERLTIDNADNAEINVNETYFNSFEITNSKLEYLDLSTIGLNYPSSDLDYSNPNLDIEINDSRIKKLVFPQSTEMGFIFVLSGEIEDFQIPKFSGDENLPNNVLLSLDNIKELDNYILNGNESLDIFRLKSDNFTKFDNSLLNISSCSFTLPKLTSIDDYQNIICNDNLELDISNIKDFDSISQLNKITNQDTFSTLTLYSDTKTVIKLDSVESLKSLKSISVNDKISFAISDEVSDYIDENIELYTKEEDYLPFQ